MRHLQFAMVLFLSVALPGVCAAGPPKTVDCLLVSVVPNSADPAYALNPPQTRPGIRRLHMILTNVCSVDITAFTLNVNVTSPIPQELQFGADVLGRLAQLSDKQILRAGTEFPFDWIISGEPDDDPRPLELTVQARGLIFRDGTAAGDATWVTDVQKARKGLVQQFATELKLLGEIAHLEDAKAILKGDPDPSLEGPVRSYWLECQRSLLKDPASWAAYVNRRAYWLRSLTEALTEHPELTMESK